MAEHSRVLGVGGNPTVKPVDVRFFEKVAKSDDCWTWTAAKDRDGYGVFRLPTGNAMAHRFAYELCVGPIPSGLQIDHLCRNRGCVNPEHLEPVSSRSNTMRSPVALAAINAAKSTCTRGHELDYVRPNGNRACRTCHAEAQRRYVERRTLRSLDG